MSKNYTCNGVGSSSTGPKVGLEIQATAAIRAGVWGWLIGQSATPNSTDFNYLAAITRETVFGTSGSAVVPTPCDPGDVASVNQGYKTATAEPTFFAQDSMQNPPNQRTNFFWQTYDGRELWGLSGAAAGITGRLVSAGQAIALNHTIWFRE